MLSEPIPAQIVATAEPILILGFLEDRTVICSLDDGDLAFRAGDWIRTDWRYNAETKEWYDTNGDIPRVLDESVLAEALPYVIVPLSDPEDPLGMMEMTEDSGKQPNWQMVARRIREAYESRVRPEEVASE